MTTSEPIFFFFFSRGTARESYPSAALAAASMMHQTLLVIILLVTYGMWHIAHNRVLIAIDVASLSLSTCEIFLGTPKECLNSISTPIETPPGGANQSFYASSAASLLPAINSLDPEICGPSAVAFACGNYFRPCPTNGSDLIIEGGH